METHVNHFQEEEGGICIVLSPSRYTLALIKASDQHHELVSGLWPSRGGPSGWTNCACISRWISSLNKLVLEPHVSPYKQKVEDYDVKECIL